MANKKGRAAQGSGSIRQRSDGTWEARLTYTDELGVKKRKSIYGHTQKECRQKLTAATKEADEGNYKETKRITVMEWLNEWLTAYCANLKPMTITDYRRKVERYIEPNIGSLQIKALTPISVQKFCNKLRDGYDGQNALSAKSVKNIHGILHSALKQAVLSGIIRTNPADNTKLPRVKRPELKPLMDDAITSFLTAIHGDPFEHLYVVDLFSGMRESEVIGLQWEDINFDAGEITVCRQLQKERNGGYIFLNETKNGKTRTIPIAQSVVKVLRKQQVKQAEWRLLAGDLWSNERNLVFTDELGGHLKHITVYKHFKKIVTSIGMPETRFHDLRHSCAIMALQAGCSVKSVQEQLGHYSSAFTMDTYAEVSDTMKKDTQDRMENLIKHVSDL